MKSNNLEKSQNQNKTLHLKSQNQTGPVGISGQKFPFGLSKIEIWCWKVSTWIWLCQSRLSKEKISPALQTSVFTKENQPRIAEALKQKANPHTNEH